MMSTSFPDLRAEADRVEAEAREVAGIEAAARVMVRRLKGVPWDQANDGHRRDATVLAEALAAYGADLTPLIKSPCGFGVCSQGAGHDGGCTA